VAFDFPSSPTANQVFTPVPGGPTWTWNGSAWITGAVTTGTADSYNRVVNGAMQHSQENGNVSSGNLVSIGGYYVADQWPVLWSVSPGTVAAVRNVSAVTPNGSTCMINTTVGTAKASLGATDFWIVRQNIEGNRISNLGWGTAGAKAAVVRFWISASITGTFSAVLSNGAQDRTYAHLFTISAANVWQQVVFVVLGDTTGTWPADSSKAMVLNITFAAGSTYTTSTLDAWQAGVFFAGVGSTNGMTTAGASFLVGDVGLYADPNRTGLAPPWVTPDFASELIACRRYWQLVYGLFSGNVTSGQTYNCTGPVNVLFRAAPTITITNLANINFPTTNGSTSLISANFVTEGRVANGTGTGIFSANYFCNARM